MDELPSGKFSRLYYVRSGVTDCPDNDNGYIDVYKANNSWIAIKVITLSGKVYTKAKSHGVWNDWKAVITNSDFELLNGITKLRIENISENRIVINLVKSDDSGYRFDFSPSGLKFEKVISYTAGGVTQIWSK